MKILILKAAQFAVYSSFHSYYHGQLKSTISILRESLHLHFLTHLLFRDNWYVRMRRNYRKVGYSWSVREILSLNVLVHLYPLLRPLVERLPVCYHVLYFHILQLHFYYYQYSLVSFRFGLQCEARVLRYSEIFSYVQRHK